VLPIQKIRSTLRIPSSRDSADVSPFTPSLCFPSASAVTCSERDARHIDKGQAEVSSVGFPALHEITTREGVRRNVHSLLFSSFMIFTNPDQLSVSRTKAPGPHDQRDRSHRSHRSRHPYSTPLLHSCTLSASIRAPCRAAGRPAAAFSPEVLVMLPLRPPLPIPLIPESREKKPLPEYHFAAFSLDKDDVRSFF
jgi:hypothetical protein